MRRRSVPLRVTWFVVVASLAAVAACEDPTEVTLVLTTDVPCSMLAGTTITVGTADELENKDFVADTSVCAAGGSGVNSIGTFVVVPSHGRSDAFAVRVVSGVGRQAHDCAQGGQAPDYTNCIVARRELTFVPHTPLTLPIVMRKDCENRACTAQQTCVDGECFSDMILTPNRCTGSGCSESVLVDGGVVVGSDASPSPDGTTADTLVDDGPGRDAPSDRQPAGDAPLSDGSTDGAMFDGAVVDGSPADATMQDAPGADAPGGDSTTADAPGSDGAAVDALAPDTGGPGDASVLGSCVDAGTSAGVTCGGVTCASGAVCCVGQPTTGSPTYSCASLASCNTTATGGTTYSSLACRDIGDCAAGSVCCLVPPMNVGDGYITACKAPSACPNSFTTIQACQNSCECAGVTCKIASACPTALALATCGGSCI